MKNYHWVWILAISILATSCSSVSVYADYEKSAPFSQYRTYAFSKTEIDKVEISTLDKKRILRELESQLADKGFIKSENPDLMISFFTKSNQRMNIANNGGWGWGPGINWSPGYGWGGSYIYSVTEGTLFINFVDTKKNELVWQGQGTGVLKQDPEKKDKMIKEFIEEIIKQYPPQL
uniref:DUF4136 domain-containing protein n=1 Tax=Flavobacterium sp. TaxID=239 RepID=UPI004049237D